VAKIGLVLNWAHLVEFAPRFIAKRGRSKDPNIPTLQLDRSRTPSNREEVPALEGPRIG
jgi:hypothetical protein